MSKKTIIIVICFIVVIAAGILYTSDTFGVSASNIEKDARKSHKIDNTWAVSKSICDKIGAMIFYNDSRDMCTTSIYIKREGLSFGYFFLHGGAINGVNGVFDGILEYTLPDPYAANGTVLFSLNFDRVTRIQLDNGVNITNISIDPNNPFIAVIPTNPGSVTLFNDEGRIIPINPMH